MISKPAEILVLTPASEALIKGCARLGPCLRATRAEVLAGRVEGLAAVRAVAAWDVVVDGALFERLPALELVANQGVGYDKVDVAAATARGIAVTHTPDVLTDEVADFTLGLLIMTIRRLGEAERFLRAGRWEAGPFPLSHTLRGRRVGILGTGRIGKAVATRLEGFGVSLAYSGRRPQPDLAYPYFPDARQLAGAVDTLISILPGGAETRRLVDAEVLAALGADGVFVNVGRGSTVDEAALATALRTGVIAAAGLDVFEHEPHVGPELLELENAVLMPHVASATVHTRAAMSKLVVDNIAVWLADGRALTPTPETRAGLPVR
ncbi:2-hydroxyacid dehydrogenase [Phenylobacterium hankyongense]|uniref:2-hydroxyacid dehydrogenase n=1 Tax=Phenylobacterium hankyongense TaxID=1813876 RepID=A0A328ATT2_9CAUL|nr:2-hydroxyacid dehydrogenase [Phenylobacterium hankyongense]RAK58542.1 2-hydroxyacid dehydrogenase [Phenylobacterium hankyongense]